MLCKSFSRAFVVVSLCAFFAASASASKPAAYLSRESLERRIADGAAAGAKLLKQFDVRRAVPSRHSRRQVSIVPADREAQPTPAAQARPFVALAVTTTRAASIAVKTGAPRVRRQLSVPAGSLSTLTDGLNGLTGSLLPADPISFTDLDLLKDLDNTVVARQDADQVESTPTEDVQVVDDSETALTDTEDEAVVDESTVDAAL